MSGNGSEGGGGRVVLGLLVAIIGIILLCAGTGAFGGCSSPTVTIEGEIRVK